jgi:hypothetical protein
MDQDSRLAEDLISLGKHLLAHYDLPRVASVRPDYTLSNELNIQLWKETEEGLGAWARTLTDVSSNAIRLGSDRVHAYVRGLIYGRRVCVWTQIPGDVFPEGKGAHEWDVTVLLQEA